MAFCEIELGDEEFLEECGSCGNGYMVSTYGGWYQCSNCGVEAQMDEESGLLLYDEYDLMPECCKNCGNSEYPDCIRDCDEI